MRMLSSTLIQRCRHDPGRCRPGPLRRATGGPGRVGVLLASALLLAGIAPSGADSAGPPTVANPARELQVLLQQGELTSAEAGAARLLAAARPVNRQDSLVVLDATRILIQARLSLGRFDDPTMPELVRAFLLMCTSLLDSNAVEQTLSHQYAAVLARYHGEYAAAIEHYQSALDAVIRRVGPNHPETAMAIANFATVYFAMRDYAKARELLTRALQIQEQQLAPDHLDIANTLFNLNEAKAALGDTVDVAAGYARVVAIFETHEGPNSSRVGDVLHREGVWRLQCRDVAGAARALDRAVAIREIRVPGSVDLAASLLARARADLERAETDSASSRAGRALRLYQTLRAPRDPEVAGCLVFLGDVARHASRYDEATDRYNRALEILRHPSRRDPAGLAACLRALASFALQLARHDEAVAYAREALEIDAGHWGLLHRETEAARVAYAAALRAAQQPDSAAAHFQRALTDLAQIGGEDDPALAEPLLGLGALARERYDWARARSYVERALALRERAFGPNDPSLARCLHELAIVQRLLGDESGAQVSLQRSLRLAATRQHDTPEVAAVVGSLATLERARGDAPAAEAHFREALAILERVQLSNHPQYAQVLRNLASLENAAGRFPEAEAHYGRALGILEPLLPDHPDVAATHLGLGNAFKAQGKKAYARDHYRRAIEIHRGALGPEAAPLALDYYNLATLLLESGELKAAMDTATVAEELSQRHFRLVAQGVSEREALYYSAGRVRGTDIVLTCAARSESQADWEQAWDLVIRSRAVVLEEMAARRRVLAATPDPAIVPLNERLTVASNRLARLAVQGRGTLSPASYQGLLEAARREKEDAERDLAVHSAPFRLRRAREGAGFHDVAKGLPPKTALIAWVRFERLERAASAERPPSTPGPAASAGEPTYAAFVLGAPTQPIRFAILGAAKDLDALIARWHKEAGSGPRMRGRDAAQQAYFQAGQALRRAVWDPVAEGLEGMERIFLVPDGALALVNFDALPDDADGYLLESVPLLQVLSSERDLIQEEESLSSGEGLLTAAAPDYELSPAAPSDSSAGESGQPATRGIPCGQFKSLSFAALPGTLAEERDVARLWLKYGARSAAKLPGNRRPEILELVGTAASERDFKRFAGGRSILHIATHGFFLGAECTGRRANVGAAAPDELTLSGLMAESPLLLSGLAFAGANARERAPTADDDGILTAEEIAALNLSGVDCVVLSACETGLGKVEAGEGVFGLRRAFQVAGARSLVMTLWAVDDLATSQWMEAMFEQRLRWGRTVAEAVRAASLEVLQRRRSEHLDTHPFYWGAFVTTGDWR